VAHSSKDLAAELLDAQVDWAVDELTGATFAELVARDVDDLLDLAARFTMADLVDAEAVTATALRLLEQGNGNELIAELVVGIADAIYALPASKEHRLGDLVEREHVEALVSAVLGMTKLHDRAMDRLAESPSVGVIATTFVGKIVGDFLQQNRQLAEKVPGVSSLFSIGIGAANKVRSATVDQFLGDAAGKSAQFAIKRTNSAIRDLIRDAPLQQAAMEVWDLHAGEPISELRKYLSDKELREIVVLGQAIVTDVEASEFAGALLRGCIEVVFERYGARDIASLLDDLGVERDELVAQVVGHAAPILETLRASGDLERLIRARLGRFYQTPAAKRLLTAAG
jgi:hypothetical protein